MTIRVPFSPILFDLFPEAQGDRGALVEAMRSYYTVRGVAPSVTWEGDDILIQVDAERIMGRERMFRNAVAPCDRGDFHEGRTRLEKLAVEDPTHSEYYRMLGQVASELGEPRILRY